MKSKTVIGLLCGLLCAAVLVAALCSGAILMLTPAKPALADTVNAYLNPNITVNIDGTNRTFYNAQGKEVHPISYNGTTYLPLRAIGEIMGQNTNWDSATNTATLGGIRTDAGVAGTPDVNARPANVKLYLRPDITVIINNTPRTFYNANGARVVPAVYNGSIYLPLRAIGEIMGKNVSWDETMQTALLTTQQAGGTVTDYDTATPTTPAPADGITLEEAKELALNHAGKTASAVTFVKARLDNEDRQRVYEIEFICQNGNSYLEYDYDISAADGKILSYDYDAEGYTKPAAGNATVSEAAAKKTALAKVPGATEDNLYEFHKDYDDGRWEYEGKIIYNEMKYEFTIEATGGQIIEWEAESVYH